MRVHARQQPTDVLATHPCGALAAWLVEVAVLLDAAIALPAVGDHPRARLDVRGNERVQRGGGRIGQDLHPAAPEPTRFGDLNGYA